MHRFTLLLAFILILLIGYGYMRARPPERWVVYYGGDLPAETFFPFDVIVFDRQTHPPLAPLKEKRKTVLGYVSLGEAETFRDNFEWIKKQQLILNTGPEWKGNPAIDVRKPEWEKYLLEEIIPGVISQGFDGIMIDTADSTIWLEHTLPRRYPGLQKAAVGIIKKIRARFPDLTIMLNRGFPLLPQVGGDIDMVLAESIFDSPGHPYRSYVDELKNMQQQFPNLKIYSLDYLDAGQFERKKRIYQTQREQGFIPYVAPHGLQAIFMESE